MVDQVIKQEFQTKVHAKSQMSSTVNSIRRLENSVTGGQAALVAN